MIQTLSIWRNQTFQMYAFCRLISNLGTALYMIALPLTVYQLTSSGTSMGLMGMFETLPLLLNPFAGAVVDRMSRRSILIWTGFLQAAVVGMMPILNVLGVLTYWHMYLFGLLLGFVTIFMRSAEFAVIPVLFKDDIQGANAGLSLMWNISQLLGPALAGLLLVVVDPFVLIALNAVSFLAVALVFIKIRFEENVTKIRSAKQFLRDVKEGFSIIFHSKILAPMMGILALSNLADNGLIVLLYYHMKETLLLGNNAAGWVTTALGIGAIIGTLLVARMKNMLPITIFYRGFLIATLGTLLFLVPHWLIIPGALIIISIGSSMVSVGESMLIQKMVPNEMLGRVNGTSRMIKLATRPLSMFLLLFFAQHWGSYLAFLLAAGLNTISVIMILSTPLMAYGTKESTLSS